MTTLDEYHDSLVEAEIRNEYYERGLQQGRIMGIMESMKYLLDKNDPLLKEAAINLEDKI